MIEVVDIYTDYQMTDYEWLKLAADFDDVSWQLSMGHCVEIDGQSYTFTADGYCLHVVQGDDLAMGGVVWYDKSQHVHSDKVRQWSGRSAIYEKVKPNYQNPVELCLKTEELWRVVAHANFKTPTPNFPRPFVRITVTPDGDIYATTDSNNLFKLSGSVDGELLNINFTITLNAEFMQRAMRGFSEYRTVYLMFDASNLFTQVQFGRSDGRRATIMPMVMGKFDNDLIDAVGGYGKTGKTAPRMVTIYAPDDPDDEDIDYDEDV